MDGWGHWGDMKWRNGDKEEAEGRRKSRSGVVDERGKDEGVKKKIRNKKRSRGNKGGRERVKRGRDG